MRLRIGLVGAGVIARDQHAPAIAAGKDFELVGIVDPSVGLDGVPSFASLRDMIAAAEPAAVAVCTPPQVRYGIAREAIAAGLHVLLEKPPAATVCELENLTSLAERSGVTLFTAWHAQFAHAVPAARTWLATHRPRHITVDWREDVRRWHPGQGWIWEAGGLGVFDAGINAISILTAILKEPLFTRRMIMDVPENRAAPIAARIWLGTDAGTEIVATFDWRHTGTQTWDVRMEGEDGAQAALSMGGQRISGDDGGELAALGGEYPAIYSRFVTLIGQGRSDVHADPLRLVADAFLIAERRVTAPFVE